MSVSEQRKEKATKLKTAIFHFTTGTVAFSRDKDGWQVMVQKNGESKEFRGERTLRDGVRPCETHAKQFLEKVK